MSLEEQARFKEERRQAWLKTTIDPWAAKHGITRVQAISILYFDNTLGGPHFRDAFQWAEGNDFAITTMYENGQCPGLLLNR